MPCDICGKDAPLVRDGLGDGTGMFQDVDLGAIITFLGLKDEIDAFDGGELVVVAA